MTQTLRTAETYYAWSARMADRAVEEAARAGKVGGPAAISAAALAIMQHQGAAALEAPSAAVAMLAEQGLKVPTEGFLQPLAFVTPVESVEAMIRSVEADIAAEIAKTAAEFEEAAELAAEALFTDWRFERLVEAMVQDAARDAQSVDIVTRPWISHVRHLVLPSCSRCVQLAGRVYRWSMEFQRHPGCDCVMVPTTLANDSLTYDAGQLALDGKVTGLSKADRTAIEMGADFNQVVNAKRDTYRATKFGKDNNGIYVATERASDGLEYTTEGTTRRGRAFRALNDRFVDESGPVKTRIGKGGLRYSRASAVRLTPKSILAIASDRDHALELLKIHGYIK